METFKNSLKTGHRFIQRLLPLKKLHLVGALFVVILLQIYRSLEQNRKQTIQRECWQTYSIISASGNINSMKENLIPTSAKERPSGVAPAVPDTFLIEKANYCTKRPNLKVIAYVHSAISATKKRQETRDTWAKVSRSSLGVVFVVGRAKSKKEQGIILKETNVYDDIVQGNYTDMYDLLIYKALNSLYWVTTFCDKVPWVLHSDDDAVIDTFKLMPMLEVLEKKGNDNKIFCHVFGKSNPKRKGKLSVTKSQYPCDLYPPYCAGPAWFTSMKTAKMLLNTVPKTKFHWVDDVYLTGFVAAKSGVQLIDTPMQTFQMLQSEIGWYVAWLNAEVNRTEAWLNISEYHSKQDKGIAHFIFHL